MQLIDNIYNIPLANKEVPGLMKDENNGAIITEFVGLRTKMYALRTNEKKKDTKKAKNIKNNVVKQTIIVRLLYTVFERGDRNDSLSIVYQVTRSVQ